MRASVIALLFMSLSLFGQSDSVSFGLQPQEAFEQGNVAYSEDRLEEAINYYQEVISNGKESWELYFNMGNAYFKMGLVPEAILYYEKARKLNPQEEDIQANLEIANLKTVDKVESKPELPLGRWWRGILNAFSIDDWAWMSIVLSFTALAVMIVFLFLRGMAKRISFFSALFFFGLSILFFILGNQQKGLQTSEKYAIVFTPSVTVKSEPEEDATKLFVIHEGTKIQVLKQEGDWNQISLMNGNKGWVKTGTFRGI